MSYRVLHVVHSNQRRGAEVFAAQLAANLSRSQFDSALCFLHPVSDGGISVEGVRTFALNGDARLPGSPGVFDISKMLGLRRVLADFQPDVILAHGSSSLKYCALGRLLYRRGVCIYRNIGIASFWAGSPLKVRLNRTLLKGFDAVVSLSPLVRDDFLKVYGMEPDRVVIIPNGVEAEVFEGASDHERRSSMRETLGFREDDIIIASVGSLSPEKNQQQLLQLMRDIQAENGSVKLLMIGDGPLRAMLQKKTEELGISESVKFLGVRDDVADLLGASDIFALPSTTESMPAVLIEAGLAGLSAVAYDVGAIPDVVVDGVTGAVASEGDYAAFKGAIVRLIQDGALRERMGQAARQRCRSLFDIKKVAKDYEMVFLSLLSGEAPLAVGTRMINEDSKTTA